MKRKTITGILLAGTLGAFAGVDNVAITFSTPGPDTYRDGRTVLDGECYALVWTPAGETFGGIAADGTAAEPSKLVLKAPVAKGGRCPRVLFEVDEDYAKANFPGGTWNVVLLDTRRFATDADGVIVKDADGLPKVASWGVGSSVVNDYGAAGAAVVGTLGAASAADAVASGSGAALPKGFGKPTISDFRVIGGNVYITVKGSHGSMRYGVRSGKRLDALAGDGKSRYGKTGGELIIVKPQNGESGFYAVEEVKE